MHVYGECECFGMQMLYVCVLCATCGSSAICMTCSLLMLVVDAISDHTEQTYSRAGLITNVLVLRCGRCVTI